MSPDSPVSAEIFDRLERLERSRDRWRLVFTLLAGGLVLGGVVFANLFVGRNLSAQESARRANVEQVAQKLRRAEAPVAEPAAGFEYRQSLVQLDRMAVTLNEWADKGWEPVQIVFVPPSLGAGGPGQVAIAMRRLARPR